MKEQLLALMACTTIGIGSGCTALRSGASAELSPVAWPPQAESWEEVLTADLETVAWLNQYSALEKCTVVLVESEWVQPQSIYPPFDAWGEPAPGIGSRNLLLVGYLHKPDLGVTFLAYGGTVETLVGGNPKRERFSFPGIFPGAIISFLSGHSSDPRVYYRLFQ